MNHSAHFSAHAPTCVPPLSFFASFSVNARLISFCASIPIGEVGGGAPGSDGLDDFSTSELAREAVESFPVSGSSATNGNGTENQKQLPLGAWVSTPMEPPTCDKRWEKVKNLPRLVFGSVSSVSVWSVGRCVGRSRLEFWRPEWAWFTVMRSPLLSSGRQLC